MLPITYTILEKNEVEKQYKQTLQSAIKYAPLVQCC